jgi:CBS domain-containing protein
VAYPVSNLLENKSKPLPVQLSTSLLDALSLMRENDYSQLPVLDADKKPIGFVTYSSIARTLHYLDCSIDELSVNDAYEKIDKTQIYRGDDDLFTMLDRLRDTNAVLVVNGEDQLEGIITSYDATEFFRRRAEDMMHVEDVESIIKELIVEAFTKSNGETVDNELHEAIKRVYSARQSSKKDFAKALNAYIKSAGLSKMDQALMEQSYEAHLQQPENIPEFSELTLNDYLEILLHPDQASYFQNAFSHSPNHIRNLLQEVRDTRNDLAHFREVKPYQRDQLQYCKNLLERVADRVLVESSTILEQEEQERLNIEEITTEEGKPVQIYPVEEEVSPAESKYAPLIATLQEMAGERKQIRLTFDDIDKILDGGLPPSARTHRAWWANDSVGHVQSQLWLDAGWRTTSINMTDEVVVFVRIRELEKRYIQFFSALLKKLSQTNLPVKKNISPQGKNWITICQIPDSGPSVAAFAIAFSTKRRFRVELYIDSGNQEQNKRVFDLLYNQKEKIEERVGKPIEWERINSKRASRIAVYHDGNINDSDQKLLQLQSWATVTMEDFYSAILQPALDSIHQVIKNSEKRREIP